MMQRERLDALGASCGDRHVRVHGHSGLYETAPSGRGSVGVLLERHRELVREAFRNGVIFGLRATRSSRHSSPRTRRSPRPPRLQRRLTSELWPDGAMLRCGWGSTPAPHASSPATTWASTSTASPGSAPRRRVPGDRPRLPLGPWSARARSMSGSWIFGDHVLKDFDEQAPLYQLRHLGLPAGVPAAANG